MKTLQIMAIAVLMSVIGAAPSLAQCGMGGHGSHQGHQQHDAAPSVSLATSIATYPLNYCLITGEALGSRGDPVIRTYNGHQIKFCCDKCPAKFEQDQEMYLKKLDDAIIAAQKADYPLDKCVVSGEKLGGMGEPYDYVYNNELVRFCCGGCVPKFQQDPEKYMKKLHKSSGNKTARSSEEMKPENTSQPSTHQH